MQAPPPRRRFPPGLPDWIWAPLTAAGVMLFVGLLGVAANQPWLFPSLGPTVFLQAELPNHRTARFRNTVLGHLIGLSSGYLAVYLSGANQASSVLETGNLTAVRVGAAALTVAITILLMVLLRASHPPAVSTGLLVALGSIRPTPRDAVVVVAGVLLVAMLGEMLRRFRLGLIVGHWGDLRPR